MNTLITSATWVIKIGSAVLTGNGRGLDTAVLADWVGQICSLRASRGLTVILVTSGSVAEGVSRLGWAGRPLEVHKLQAAASVGQLGLMNAYDGLFRRHGVLSAQILLTHDDFAVPERHRNVAATLQTLLGLGVVPIINENDAVSTEEIGFGDNDMLAALVANIVNADRLVLVTDQDGIYTADPRCAPNAQLIRNVCVEDDGLSAAAGEGGAWGKGGMASKVRAARMFALSGGVTSIVPGRAAGRLLALEADPPSVGTQITPGRTRLARHGQWLAGMRKTAGSIILHDQAVRELAGGEEDVRLRHVRRVDGSFRSSELVRIVTPDGVCIARGLCNYDSIELSRIVIDQQAKKETANEVIHRTNLVNIDIYPSYFSSES
jgi:glutamate 5-kinase